MYAVVLVANVEDPENQENLRQLREQVAVGVSQAPGFVAGYWLKPSGNGEGLSVVVLETQEQAQASAERAKEMFGAGQVPQGVTLKSVDVREVIANK